jgi:hypothetical protein
VCVCVCFLSRWSVKLTPSPSTSAKISMHFHDAVCRHSDNFTSFYLYFYYERYHGSSFLQFNIFWFAVQNFQCGTGFISQSLCDCVIIYHSELRPPPLLGGECVCERVRVRALVEPQENPRQFLDFIMYFALECNTLAGCMKCGQMCWVGFKIQDRNWHTENINCHG